MQVCKAAMSPEQYEKYQAKQMRKRSDYAKVAYMLMICMKRQAKPEKIMPEWEEQCATACAMQNLQLMTTALGLGGMPFQQRQGLDADISEAALFRHCGISARKRSSNEQHPAFQQLHIHT